MLFEKPDMEKQSKKTHGGSVVWRGGEKARGGRQRPGRTVKSERLLDSTQIMNHLPKLLTHCRRA
jgi:hypothetical protein